MAEEQPEMREKRKAIIDIMQDKSITPQEQQKRIQALMNPKWAESQILKSNELTEEDKQVTYNKEGVLGCKHYMRDCKLKAACCGKFYPCLRCHDEVSDHTIVRYDIELILCMHCETVQPPNQTCTNCKKTLGTYYCETCRFYDNDTTKEIYHCPHCRLCRIGKGLGIDHEHCMTCNSCIKLDFKHKCVESNTKCDCPICKTYLFESPLPVTILPRCGHAIHLNCLEQYRTSSWRCPVCMKSFLDPSDPRMKQMFEIFDQEINLQPMPEELRKTVSVFCNDCEKKSTVSYHLIGQKCGHPGCGSYNTNRI
eukprot:TRINITY_DN7421_c0_g1_i1.p1 TRINITY_DN7421_c0_g1~~TRINITY_DN7421_c0_g1_i1.p1  ORF type:complete len:310 (-),score=12.02 TRINITY_DN7421_c0_g1_i1:79-1008(-)